MDVRPTAGRGLAGRTSAFLLLSRLGRGTFGTVWRARVPGPRAREVAVKIAHAGIASCERALRHEARVLGMLRHRAIVASDGLVELEGGALALVMEHVDGVDLAAFRGFGPLPPAIALRVVAEVADALRYGWTCRGPGGAALRLRHRDIKPGNVLLTEDGRVKLLDFGIAAVEPSGPDEVATPGVIWGSSGYISPERQLGHDGVAGDVFALGVVAGELLTGQRLGSAGHGRDDHRRFLGRARGLLASARVPADAAALVSAMLSFDPKDRPSLRDIGRAGDGSLDPAATASAVRAVRRISADNPTIVRAAGTPTAPTEPSGRVSRWLASVASLAGSVLGAP